MGDTPWTPDGRGWRKETDHVSVRVFILEPWWRVEIFVWHEGTIGTSLPGHLSATEALAAADAWLARTFGPLVGREVRGE